MLNERTINEVMKGLMNTAKSCGGQPPKTEWMTQDAGEIARMLYLIHMDLMNIASRRY